jgi:hypothetical protein
VVIVLRIWVFQSSLARRKASGRVILHPRHLIFPPAHLNRHLDRGPSPDRVRTGFLAYALLGALARVPPHSAGVRGERPHSGEGVHLRSARVSRKLSRNSKGLRKARQNSLGLSLPPLSILHLTCRHLDRRHLVVARIGAGVEIAVERVANPIGLALTSTESTGR